MLTESDRKEVLFAIKEYLKVNGLKHDVIPETFTYVKPILDNDRFIRSFGDLIAK